MSLVLNDPKRVKPETRRRVDDAIRELDYRPNTVARALASGRSWTIGVVSFDTRLYGPASTLHAIHEAAHDAGYLVNIASLDSLERGPILDAVRRLRIQAVDGVIIIAPEVAAAQALREIPPEIPAVAVEGLMNVPIPMVAVNQHQGAARATKHLLDLGHRTVWHIPAPRTGSRRGPGSRAGIRHWPRPVPRSIPRCPVTGALAPFTSRPAPGGEPARGDRGLRRQRPDGTGRAACLP